MIQNLQLRLPIPFFTYILFRVLENLDIFLVCDERFVEPHLEPWVVAEAMNVVFEVSEDHRDLNSADCGDLVGLFEQSCPSVKENRLEGFRAKKSVWRVSALWGGEDGEKRRQLTERFLEFSTNLISSFFFPIFDLLMLLVSFLGFL